MTPMMTVAQSHISACRRMSAWTKARCDASSGTTNPAIAAGS